MYEKKSHQAKVYFNLMQLDTHHLPITVFIMHIPPKVVFEFGR